ncbi:hypothetical protein LIER_02336 [Lithospermum erythrorhizon]|uniref:Uncharacterized protein n=1 Tax=Lithospermum erythrorhizon TaxID=34254 RepID=A0AAV3NPT3_LITER
MMVDYDFKDDEAEETLSLSDLVTHDVAAWDDYSSTDHMNLEQECFEFFTDEWSAKIITLPHRHHQNIIFCGKLIQSKNPTFTKTKESHYSNGNNNNVGYGRLERIDSSLVHGKMLAIPTLLRSSRKSRWCKIFLGMDPMIKPSGGVQLREIKQRLSRLRRPIEGGQQADDEYRKKSKGGLWGLVKALGCGEYNHATAVKESIKGISRV